MRTRPTILFFSPEARAVPGLIGGWAQANALPVETFTDADAVEAIVLRGGQVAGRSVAADLTGTEGEQLYRKMLS